MKIDPHGKEVVKSTVKTLIVIVAAGFIIALAGDFFMIFGKTGLTLWIIFAIIVGIIALQYCFKSIGNIFKNWFKMLSKK